MDRNPVFRELLDVLPEWMGKLRAIGSKRSEASQTQSTTTPSPPQNFRKRAASENGNDPVTTSQQEDVRKSAGSGVEDETTAVKVLAGPYPPRPKSPDAKNVEITPFLPTGKLKMPQKPGGKQKFSFINGPQIYYDGEAQRALFECWSALNSKRGLLRKEMMAVKRKRIILSYSFDDDDEEEGAGVPVETEEVRKAREEAARRKAEEDRLKAEREKAVAEVFEYIDSCLDKASKGCENAAFLWLKGDVCPGHITFINARMAEAVGRISSELEKVNPKSKPVKPPAPSVAEDEGLGAEMEVDPNLALPQDPPPEQSSLPPPRKMGTAMHASKLVGAS